MSAISTFCKELTAEMGKESFVISSAFLMGFAWSWKLKKRSFKRPLSTTLIASINGCFCVLGGQIVSVFVPEEYAFIIPLVCIASIIYSKYSDIYGHTADDLSLD